VWKDAGIPQIRHFNRQTAQGRIGVVLVIPEGVRDSKGLVVASVCLFLDGCHCGFHSHHRVESDFQIVKLMMIAFIIALGEIM